MGLAYWKEICEHLPLVTEEDYSHGVQYDWAGRKKAKDNLTNDRIRCCGHGFKKERKNEWMKMEF
jgi:hypothetical protein